MYSEPSSGIKLTAYSCICWLFHRIEVIFPCLTLKQEDHALWTFHDYVFSTFAVGLRHFHYQTEDVHVVVPESPRVEIVVMRVQYSKGFAGGWGGGEATCETAPDVKWIF